MKSTVEVVDYKKAVMKFKSLPEQLLDTLIDTLYENALEMRNRIIKSMTETPRAPWFYWRGKKPGRKKHHPSMPGFPPARDTGELVSRLVAEARQDEVEVGVQAGAPYAEFLEDKTKLNRPFMEPMLNEMKPEIENNVLSAIKQSAKDSLR